MRTTIFDLSEDNNYSPRKFGGYVGEHNFTELKVILPFRMLNENISYYYFEFQTPLGEHINSLNIYPISLVENTIKIILWEQLLAAKGDLQFCISAVRIEDDGSISIRGKTNNCILQIS